MIFAGKLIKNDTNKVSFFTDLVIKVCIIFNTTD